MRRVEFHPDAQNEFISAAQFCESQTEGLGLDAENARLDTLAALMADPEPDWARVREAYSTDEALRVPSVVVSFPRGRPIEVAADV